MHRILLLSLFFAPIFITASGCTSRQSSQMTNNHSSAIELEEDQVSGPGISAFTPHRFTTADWKELTRELEMLAHEIRAGGQAGISIVEVDSGKEASVGGNLMLPMHSVFKTWVALACADAVSRRELSWDESIFVSRDFLTYSYQPLSETVPIEGRDFTIGELVRWSIIQSDNPSVDLLLRRLGGPSAVQERLSRLMLHDIEIDTDEAGLARFAKEIGSIAASFSNVSDRGKFVREQILRHPNRATASASARSLANLALGRFSGLDPEGRIVSIHEETVTGAARLSRALKPEWKLAHKTGTGPRIADIETGVNDLGLFIAPDGKRYSVAVFFAGSSLKSSALEALIARVGSLLISQHEKSSGRH